MMESNQGVEQASAERHEDRRRPAGQRTRLIALVPLASGLLTIPQGIALGAGDFTAPGPGLFPTLVGAGLVVLAAPVCFIDHANDVERFHRGSWRAVAGMVSLLLFALLWSQVGLTIAGAALLFFWLRLLGRESLLASTLLSLTAAVGLNLLFSSLLNVPLPPDVLRIPL